jgi:uncharacterized coiled-coil protein SlyX
MAHINNWQEIADNLAKQKEKDNLDVQLVYTSNNDINCMPTFIPLKITDNLYPYVVEAPTGMKDPKYNWQTVQWEDKDIERQADAITTLKQNVAKQQETLATMQDALNKNADAQAQLLLMLGNVVTDSDKGDSK